MKRWMRLAAGVATIWLLVFVLAPWLQRWGPVGRFHAHVERSGIDATALFYTEIEEFATADVVIRDIMKY